MGTRTRTVLAASLGGVTAAVTAGVTAAALAAAPASAGTAPAAVGQAGGRTAADTATAWPGSWWRASCVAAQLAAVVEPPEGAAGNRYGRLVVTNVGRRSCRLYGYSAMLLRDAAGRALPTRLRAVNPGPARVVLRPGDRAAVNLHWTVVPGPGEPVDRPCEPRPASLLVWPPRRRQPFSAAWSFGPVCQHGLIDVSAYHAL